MSWDYVIRFYGAAKRWSFLFVVLTLTVATALTMDELVEQARQHLDQRRRLAQQQPWPADIIDIGRHPCPVYACWKNLEQCSLLFFQSIEQGDESVSYAFVPDGHHDTRVIYGPLDQEGFERLKHHSWGAPVVYRYDGQRKASTESSARTVEYLAKVHAATRMYYGRLDAASRFSQKVMDLREARLLDEGLDESALHSGLLVLAVSAVEAGLRDVFQTFQEAWFQYLKDDVRAAKRVLRRIVKQLSRDHRDQRKVLQAARRGRWSPQALQAATEPLLDQRRINFQDFTSKGGGGWAYNQFLGISLVDCANAVDTQAWARIRAMLLDRHRVAHAFEEAKLSREALVQDIDGARRFFSNVLLRTVRHVNIDRDAPI